MQMIKSERQEPKRVFRCRVCDPPEKRRGVLRRYRFVFRDDIGHDDEYCLPCAAGFLERRQWDVRMDVDRGVSPHSAAKD